MTLTSNQDCYDATVLLCRLQDLLGIVEYAVQFGGMTGAERIRNGKLADEMRKIYGELRVIPRPAHETPAKPSGIFAELGRHHPDCSVHSTIAPATPICNCGADAKRVVEDMNNLRHMLGVGSHIPKKDWGYRNYFNAGPGHSDMPSLLRLEAAGLIRQGRPEYWHATEAGARAIGLTDKQIKKAFEA